MKKVSDAEWCVLQVLWENETNPLGTIVECLKPLKNWSRNTVHTYLTRMEGKGLVAINRSQEPHQYSAAVCREDCARQERASLLEKVYRGSAGDLIAAFLKETQMTQKERDLLRRMLDEMEV